MKTASSRFGGYSGINGSVFETEISLSATYQILFATNSEVFYLGHVNRLYRNSYKTIGWSEFLSHCENEKKFSFFRFEKALLMRSPYSWK